MTHHRDAVIAAIAGFALTLSWQLPPILEDRAMYAGQAAAFETQADEETVNLDRDATARLNQLLRNQG